MHFVEKKEVIKKGGNYLKCGRKHSQLFDYIRIGKEALSTNLKNPIAFLTLHNQNDYAKTDTAVKEPSKGV